MNASAKRGAENHTSKIGAVLTTLQDILQAVVNEEVNETRAYNQYRDFSLRQNASIHTDLANTRTALQNARVQSQEQRSNIDSWTVFIRRSEREMRTLNDQIAQAGSVRKKANDGFTNDMDMNNQSINQIRLAIRYVGRVQRQGGFLQDGVLKKVAANQPGESSYIYGIMKGLMDRLNQTRSRMNSSESQSLQTYNGLMRTKRASLATVTAAKTAKKIRLAETNALEVGTQQTIARLRREIATLERSLKESNAAYKQANAEWKIRQADRAKEKVALNQTIAYIEQTRSVKNVTLLQKSSKGRGRNEEVEPAIFAPSFLQDKSTLQRRMNHAEIAAKAYYAEATSDLMDMDDQISTHTRNDTFSGVKSVIQNLITTHKNVQKEEKKRRKRCQDSIAAKEDELSTTTEDWRAQRADIGVKRSRVRVLAGEIRTLYRDISTLNTTVVDATWIRRHELAMYTQGTRDRRLAMRVLNQAKSVLAEFYRKKKTGLVHLHHGNASNIKRTKVYTTKKFSPKSTRKNTASFGAESMIQDIIDDVSREQKDATMAENDAKMVFRRLVDSSNAETDDKTEDIRERVRAKAKLLVQIGYARETLRQQVNDLRSIGAQLQSLHTDCDDLIRNYRNRTNGRNFEVAQLRDVMDIVSGSSIAARTGLMQAGDALTTEGLGLLGSSDRP